jgi:GT2 family glycosyltransferase
MLAQGAAEVIVVDYSCPQGTAEFVRANFPDVIVLSVAGETHFSNWKARNAGAHHASSDILVFVDADTILADGAIDSISKNLPAQSYGFFDRKTSQSFNRSGPRLASNQLKGFHVIPAEAFRRLGGYDEVLVGYAAGADTDLEERLLSSGIKKHPLDAAIISSIIEHDAASRTEHHAEPVRTSYGAGLLYRAAKRMLLRMRRESELPRGSREKLYAAARKAVAALGPDQNRVSMNVTLSQDPILMPRQLGYERGVQSVALRVEVVLEGRIPG